MAHIKCTRLEAGWWAAALWIGGVCELWADGTTQLEAIDALIRMRGNEYKPGPNCNLAF